jgi:hypothetical protein
LVRNQGKSQNLKFLLGVVNWNFLCLTLRFSYELVFLVIGLSNGTLEILWVSMGCNSWENKEPKRDLELEICWVSFNVSLQCII